MVVLGLGKVADAVHEREGLDEPGKLERPLESLVHLAPAADGHGAQYLPSRRMTVSTESSRDDVVDGEQRRAGRELVLELVFRPLSRPLVAALAQSRVAPTAVVLANAVTGLIAAVALARGQLLGAALLLQVKTLLDNTDGQLARASGRVTPTGRYLDTEADLVVNAALFAALGYVSGQALLAAGAFVALTLVLAVDFNATEVYRDAHGTAIALRPATGDRTERVLKRIYDLVFGPLDRAIRRPAWRDAVDEVTVTVLANLGLSTQLAVLGICLVAGAPEAYLVIVLGCAALVAGLLARTELRARSS
jgi:archaetidylinositol phosphate synthase